MTIQDENLYNRKSHINNRNISSSTDNGRNQNIYQSKTNHNDEKFHNKPGSDNRYFSSDYHKTGQDNGGTANDKIRHNHGKTISGHNADKENGNDKRNGYSYMSNTIDDNDRNENYHNRRNDISSYDPSENRQFKELTGRITGIEHDRTNSLQELSLNDENMLNHGSNYESESLSATAINGDSSYDRDASNSFRHNEAKHENYHSGITYGRAEIRHETNETSHSNQNSNGIDEKDEEDTDECSDQEFRINFGHIYI
ncbi:unnamed protein product [Wuchereria bancrofti]|uniref:Uncharacterized protein n=1 Tax=Wuchereria bancrofti TaxID=6293 RepID=A0A3P7EAV9_WUCBA|nr:unnamed protein product [Wuchereria bancrofti]